MLNKYSESDKFYNTFHGSIGFNIAFLVHDEFIRPMPDFDKVATFELIHYMVNYDKDGSLSQEYAGIPDFPAKG